MIEISPHDVLFFRESRDFTAGQAHVGRSVEPLPHTVTGALMGALFARGALDVLNLERSGGKLCKKKIDDEWHPEFSIEGVFFHNGKNPLFKVPMDIVETEWGVAELRSYQPLEGHEPAVYAEVRGDNEETVKKTLRFSPLEGFVDWGFLSDYLGGKPKLKEVPVTAPYRREERVGIALSELKTTVSGMFYRTTFLRLLHDSNERVTIAVYPKRDSEQLLREYLGEFGTLKLGGESRFAGFRFREGTLPTPERRTVKAGGIIRAYLASPVVDSLDSLVDALRKEFKKEVKLLKVFTTKRIPVTGWDMVERMPKPVKYAVPAGTVLWFKAKEELRIPGKVRLGKMMWSGYGLVYLGVMA